MAEYLIGQGAPAEKVRVIENWAHEKNIRPIRSQDSNLRRELGFHDQFVVGYSGNMGLAHDPHTILQALRSLKAETDILFLFIGGGSNYNLLQASVEAEGLENAIFLPYQPIENLSDSMAAADIHLVSLRPELEGQIVPSKFYGIAAAGRPVLFIGDIDGEIARVICDADCGVTVRQGDGEKLAQIIVALKEAGTDKLVQMGDRARKALDSRFSRDRSHKLWRELLQKLSNPLSSAS